MYSVSGVIWYLSSRWVFMTHTLFAFARKVPRQRSINVWHGMPIKAVGTFLHGHDGTSTRGDVPFLDQFDLLVANDERYQKVLARAFALPEERVVVCDSPRNGYLVPNASIKRELAVSGRLGVWLPTFRTRNVDVSSADADQRPLAARNVTQTSTIDFEALNVVLRELDFSLLVKAHPSAVTEEPVQYSHLKTIDNEWLQARDLSLYRLLGGSDLLITDISSVYNDFKSCGGEVIVYMDDFEAYVKGRNLCFERFDDVVSNTVLGSQDQLCEALRRVRVRVDPEASSDLSERAVHANAHQLLDIVGCLPCEMNE